MRHIVHMPPQWPVLLINIDFDIPAGERVAVVRRTGAGKSTSTLALIRALESVSGQITIDGINIASITLDQLRQAVTLVPKTRPLSMAACEIILIDSTITLTPIGTRLCANFNSSRLCLSVAWTIRLQPYPWASVSWVAIIAAGTTVLTIAHRLLSIADYD
ncbi:hypothetical protein EYZ11_009168 [Aspergillus tanneri]|uniref:ABC transporter domain-containing protein n=1 Tax=Aspergillus tanneri TaxID=1220188 RepID=A0A4S3J8J1_9EURO|nr:hypothetical protein EYZ11_009168 [Aspergillus tanneri]